MTDSIDRAMRERLQRALRNFRPLNPDVLQKIALEVNRLLAASEPEQIEPQSPRSRALTFTCVLLLVLSDINALNAEPGEPPSIIEERVFAIRKQSLQQLQHVARRLEEFSTYASLSSEFAPLQDFLRTIIEEKILQAVDGPSDEPLREKLRSDHTEEGG